MPGNAGNASNASSAGTSRNHRQGNLPAETTSFVGRTAELAELQRLLTRSRLVTLTGVGGVGKSRLALRAGARAQAEEVFSDGVWLVELSPLQDSALLAHTVAGALRLSDATARPALEVLGEWLADKALLLILDTCEHLIDGCARLISSLLSVAPGLRVLATSRQPIGVPGEQVIPVSPLPTEAEAVRLFTDRAATASPGFALHAADRQATAAVTDLCRDLDGLPLAIELAAGQLHAMSLEQLTERLRVRFDTLTPIGHP
ncbi:protein kinase, partial [Streptomyces sp. A7024]|nr:protein kinase [Streptomyces coryli]